MLALRLEAEIWDHRSHVEVRLRAVADGAEARATARLDAAALPGYFLPLTPGGGRLGTGYRIADGASARGAELRRDELGPAAEAIARAVLVDEALDAPPTTPGVARTRADVAAAWKRLADAVPHDETWLGTATGPDAAARRLQARVARIGGPEAPELAAALERPALRTGEALRVRVSVARGRAFLATYAWQADGSVVRIAPLGSASSGRGSAMVVEAGRRLDLPPAGDPVIAVAAMPGVAESLEAVIVLASSVPFDPDRLAPAPGPTADASRRKATTAGAFLDRVAGLDRSRLRLAVLPYRVGRGG